MPVPVQPQVDAPRMRDLEQGVEVAQAVVARFARAAGQAVRVVNDQDFPARIESRKQLAQALQLVRADAAAGVPGEAVAGRAVDADQPGRTGALRERVRVLADALTAQPGRERTLEVARGGGGARAVI